MQPPGPPITTRPARPLPINGRQGIYRHRIGLLPRPDAILCKYLANRSPIYISADQSQLGLHLRWPISDRLTYTLANHSPSYIFIDQSQLVLRLS